MKLRRSDNHYTMTPLTYHLCQTLKSPKTNALADGLIKRTSSMLDVIAPKTMYITFKMKLYVTTVNSIFQPLPTFCHKQLYPRCCVGFELNTVIKSIKNSEMYWGTPLLDALKIHFQKLFTLSFLHLISIGLNVVNIDSLA